MSCSAKPYQTQSSPTSTQSPALIGVSHNACSQFFFYLVATGDAMFNGPWGYRAQYWVHPSRGLAANRELISALTPKLLAAVDILAAPDLAKLDLCACLRPAPQVRVRESHAQFGDPAPGLA